MKPYEVHITVERFPTLEQIVRFQFFCVQHGYKSLLIELSRGTACKVQLMCAILVDASSDEVALAIAQKRVEQIQEAGFHVIRVKVESPLCEGPAEYYEAHWKFKPSYRDQFSSLPGVLNWMLASWNLINGAAYLSRRFDYIGQSCQTVQQAFDQTGEYLKPGFTWEKVHYERVLYDSCRQLDAGWQGA